MRNVANIGNKKLRKDQFEMLVKLLSKINSKAEMKLFLQSFFSESENAYFGQRLDIIRMLNKNLTYEEIRNEIKAQTGTISNAKISLDSGGREYKKLLLKHKPERKGKYYPSLKKDVDEKFVSANYPGAIKF